jgi:hypothetical protein
MQNLYFWLAQKKYDTMKEAKTYFDDGNFKAGSLLQAKADAYEEVLRKIVSIEASEK